MNSNSFNSNVQTLFRPTASLENLARRATLYRIIRQFFDERGFVEVTTPTLSRDVVVDRYVDSIPVEIERCWSEQDELAKRRFPDPEQARQNATTFYLQTSPEFAMKRLVAAGMNAIYQIAHAYRRGDRGVSHNVEFTMLEWYKQGDGYREGRDFLADLAETVASRFPQETDVERQDWSRGSTVQRSFSDAFSEKTGLDPCLCSTEELIRFADDRKIPYPTSYRDESTGATKDDWIDLIFSETVQPTLGFDAPVLLFDYPASQSQLAKTSRVVDPDSGVERVVARRFELFIRGLEIANGYDELLDPGVLRERVAATSEERRQDGSRELPRESRLLAAMDFGLPQCAGCALGVDRLLCALLGVNRIDDALTFPVELA